MMSSDSFVELVQSTLDAESLDQQDADDGGRTPTTRLDNTVTIRRKVKTSKYKVIKNGNVLEVYEYTYPLVFGNRKHKRDTVFTRENSRSLEYRQRTIIRATYKIRRLANANFGLKHKFLTLTFNNEQNFDINELSECLPHYQNFMRKLRYRYENLKYITVPEFQKRGAVHYHILCNIPFIKKSELHKLWTHGFSKPKAVKSPKYGEGFLRQVGRILLVAF